MFSPFDATEVHENFFTFEQVPIPSYFFLMDQEAMAIQEAILDTLFICKQIPSFQSNGYLNKKKDLILQGLNGLQQATTHQAEQLLRICNPAREGRVLSENIGIYKKDRSIFKEALVWELSVILGCDQYIAPSLPLYIHGSEATFQPYFSVSSVGRFVKNEQEMPQKMRLEDYWALALFTFLIGHSDLNGDNLHFTKNGYVLLDNDCSFPLYNKPISTDGRYLRVPFQNVLVDFSCSQEPLTGISYERVVSTLNDWKNKENDLRNYFEISKVVQRMDSKMSEQAFWERWEKLLYLHLSPGISFRQFIQSIFPEHFKQIEIAQQLASQIIGYSVGPMSALHFLGPVIGYWPIEKKILNEVYKWIRSNHVY